MRADLDAAVRGAARRIGSIGAATVLVAGILLGTAGVVADASPANAVTSLTVTTTSLPPATACSFLSPCTPYSATLAATGGTPGYTWSLASGSLPFGLSLQGNGVILGDPFATGSFPLVVKVTDAAGSTATAGLTLVVGAPTVKPAPLAITTGSLPPVTACSLLAPCATFSTVLTATGGVPGYTWSLASGSLPFGLSLQANGVLVGRPVSPGTYPIVVKVTDSTGATATAAFTLVVPGAVVVTTTSLPPATACSILQTCPTYSAPLTATGGAPPYTWSLASGSLPFSLSLQPSGVIFGVPHVAGTYPLVVKATDSSGASATASLTLVVNAATVTSSSLAVTTTSLPPATLCSFIAPCTQYSVPLAATGGTPGYTWSLASGSLPFGLSLQANGVLLGKPYAAGTFPLVVKVTDAAGATATANLTLVVS